MKPLSNKHMESNSLPARIINKLAILDRRVALIDGPKALATSIQRVSDLRSHPFIVLLGEPGIGKSTVLEAEAAYAGSRLFKVRELIVGSQSKNCTTLFLDALDEFRIEGAATDKAYALAKAITEAGGTKWWLTCRSEDWRKTADINAIQSTTYGTPIIVAQLLPLDYAEQLAILEALDDEAPDEFLTKAEAFGANGLVESPLSLQLLHKAIASNSEWPRTRFQLFTSAIKQLTYESNDEHAASTSRQPTDEIIAATGKICLAMLITGSRAFWRSNSEPPTDDDARAYLTANDIDVPSALIRDALNTALFRGEGQSFEPLHRTIAEFLGGQTLAYISTGLGRPTALPLSRALALVTAEDGGPPTELRGLYAWFAAHLASVGDSTGAMRLIERDAATVLTYGDSAVLDTKSRRLLLHSLAQQDPYFRASEVGSISIGGLAGEDLSNDLATILNQPTDETHLRLTVFEALKHGTPVESLRPLLRSIVLCPKRPDWHRWRAADALLNFEKNTPLACRELLNTLASEQASLARETLRVHLLDKLPSEHISSIDLKSILSDYERSHDDGTVMQLYGLQVKLAMAPRPELFDTPMAEWRPKEPQRQRSLDLNHLLDDMLSKAIYGTSNLTGARLWHWTVHARDYISAPLGNKSSKAVTTWLDKHPDEEINFFEAIITDAAFNKSTGFVQNIFAITTGRAPSAAVVLSLLRKAALQTNKAIGTQLLEVAIACSNHPQSNAEAFWACFSALSERPHSKNLLKKLTTAYPDPWQIKERKWAKQQHRRSEKTRAANLAILRPIITELRSGQALSNLAWAADIYLKSSRKDSNLPSGLDLLKQLSDSTCTEAIAQGWEQITTTALHDFDVKKLGIAEAESKRYFIEAAAIAGLGIMMQNDRLPEASTLPMILAIIVLRHSSLSSSQERHHTLLVWAINRLNLEPRMAAEQLLTYWCVALDSGAVRLNTLGYLTQKKYLGDAVRLAIALLLETRPTMHSEALFAALKAAAKLLTPSSIYLIAQAALANEVIADEQRTLWSFVSFAFKPADHSGYFLERADDAKTIELFTQCLEDDLLGSFSGSDNVSLLHREAIIRLLGSSCPPDIELGLSDQVQKRRASQLVHRSIDILASASCHEAGQKIGYLLADTNLQEWHTHLRHAQARQLRTKRDSSFQHPTPATIRAALSDGPPVNANDLRAIVIEELYRLQMELHSGDTMPWKRYWNTNSHGQAIEPRVENECRDHILERLRDRLASYRIAAALPEARRGEDTRVDMLILTGAGHSLPIEIKRHSHKDLWYAASTQLQGYAASPESNGTGIYLVFWFGLDASLTPAHPEGLCRPTTAIELQQMLTARLEPAIKDTTEIIVFDVSKPPRS